MWPPAWRGRRQGASAGSVGDLGGAFEDLDMETGEVTDHLVDANKMIDGDADPGPQEEQPTPPPFAV